jgi:hypothetical protein
MSERSTGYFQFPLCLLGFRSDYKDQLQHIISYCLCEHAQRLSRSSANAPGNTALCEAAKFLHVNIGSHDAAIWRWKAATRFIRQWENRYGRDASIRIATALLWEAHNNTGLTYREFFHSLRDQLRDWQPAFHTETNYRTKYSRACCGF